GGCVVSAGARVEPGLRRPAPRRAPLRAGRRRRARREAAHARAAPPSGAARRRSAPPLGRALGRRAAGYRDRRMILHVQKVAGISGSEAHLLSLLPALRERGWDVRMLMLHEDEPGAWDFARALRDRGVPLDAVPISRDVDPHAFTGLVRYLAEERPEILHTHLVHADAY